MPGSEKADAAPRPTSKEESPAKAMDVDENRTDMDVERDLEAEMMATNSAEDPPFDTFDISDKGWSVVFPLLQLYVKENNYQGDPNDLYYIARERALQYCKDENLGFSDIEGQLIDFVKMEVRKATMYNQEEKLGAQSTLSQAVIKSNRKDLFKPLASDAARGERDNATDKARQQKRERKVNEARSTTPLQMETLLNESTAEAQSVLEEVSGVHGPKESDEDEGWKED